MATKKYDSTVARIAGNLLSGAMTIAEFNTIGWRPEHMDAKAILGAVTVARAIIGAVEMTEASPLPLEAQER